MRCKPLADIFTWLFSVYAGHGVPLTFAGVSLEETGGIECVSVLTSRVPPSEPECRESGVLLGGYQREPAGCGVARVNGTEGGHREWRLRMSQRESIETKVNIIASVPRTHMGSPPL